jgi:hypothetical protein
MYPHTTQFETIRRRARLAVELAREQAAVCPARVTGLRRLRLGRRRPGAPLCLAGGGHAGLVLGDTKEKR